MTININGNTFEMATTLRVAYKVQGQHNHEPYAKVFENIGNMTVEDQLGILYCSFACANPEYSKTYSQLDFTNYCLDHMNLAEMLEKLKELIEGIMGTKIDEPATEQVPDPNAVATPI